MSERGVRWVLHMRRLDRSHTDAYSFRRNSNIIGVLGEDSCLLCFDSVQRYFLGGLSGVTVCCEIPRSEHYASRGTHLLQ
jgi:hypothetical protein